MVINYQTFKGFHPDQEDAPDTSSLVRSNGAYLKASLFCDVPPFSEKAIYSLKEKNSKGLPSAYLIYMASVDEYDAALKIVGSIAHWDALCACKWFMEPSKWHRGLKQWRLDMARRNASLANRVLIGAAKEGDVSSARKLLDNAEKLTSLIPTTGPGRPSPRKAKEAAEKADKAFDEAAAIKALHAQVKSEQE